MLSMSSLPSEAAVGQLCCGPPRTSIHLVEAAPAGRDQGFVGHREPDDVGAPTAVVICRS